MTQTDLAPDRTNSIISVRPSNDADVPLMLAIYEYHVSHGIGDLGAYEATPFDADDLKHRRKSMRKHRLPHLVAEIDGLIAGYAYAVPFRKRPAYRYTVKHSIYVHPGRLHMGVGRALLPALIEACGAAGFRQMIGYIDGANTTSLKLHQACEQALDQQKAITLRNVNQTGARLSSRGPRRRAMWSVGVMQLLSADEAMRLASGIILQQITEGVIITDVVGTIIYVNDAAAAIHGVAELNVKPNAYSETYHLFRENGQPYPSYELPLALAVQGETVTDARWRIRRPDGREVLAIGSAQPLSDANGRRNGAILVIRDATAGDVLERKLRAAEASLAEARRRLDTLAS